MESGLPIWSESVYLYLFPQSRIEQRGLRLVDRTRRAGVLLHPTSLPGQNGIGELGREAHRFVDWLADGGQTLWQVMPLGPTGYGDSPYQCFSAFAANPLLISLEKLVEAELLSDDELESIRGGNPEAVDFGHVIPAKQQLLVLAWERFKKSADESWKEHFGGFCATHHSWLDDFALFMSLKRSQGGRSWNQWPEGLRKRKPETLKKAAKQLRDEIEREKWLQYITFEQWWDVRRHANERGIVILGDLPIFIAYDSADAWANPHLFHFDKEGNPTVVAGVPPDYFSKTGQRWGNPIYKWEAHREEKFAWWEARLQTVRETVDMIRIDHFRGFAACWEIPASEPTAEHGTWGDAPGHELFSTLRERMGDLPLVAEDLGLITPDVIELRKAFGFPGMRVLQFAWGSGAENPFLPHHHEVDTVAYTGTHDNNTTVGWYTEETTPESREHLDDYIGHPAGPIHLELLRMAYASPAMVAIAPMQDLLGLDSFARMNTPGQAAGNWAWRLRDDQLSGDLAERLKQWVELYGRG